jgi:hypothetical protein
MLGITVSERTIGRATRASATTEVVSGIGALALLFGVGWMFLMAMA